MTEINKIVYDINKIRELLADPDPWVQLAQAPRTQGRPDHHERPRQDRCVARCGPRGSMREQQAITIVEALDRIARDLSPEATITIANSQGAVIVRHSEAGTFRGSSARDALAQMLQVLT